MRQLRMGLLGCGAFAHSLTNPFNEAKDAKITAVYNRTFSKAESLGKELGVPAFASYEELIRQDYVDGVIINTSHDQHLPMSLAAASAGKHIFCEKPMALTLSECQQMVQAAQKNGVKLFVGHVTRLLPLFARVKEIIDSEAIGKPLAVNMTHYWPVLRQGWWAKRALKGGMLHSPASHDIDYLNYLLGAAVSVFAVGGRQIQPQLDYEDTMFVVVKYADGGIGSLAASLSSGMIIQSGFIIGEKGGLKYDLYGPQGGEIEYQLTGGERTREVIGDFGLPEGMRREVRIFVDWVLYDTKPLLTAEGGLRTVEIMQAAYQSSEEGKPISLPLPC
jgi:UDP-N-acetylglucosamine 3-dehydrogenase